MIADYTEDVRASGDLVVTPPARIESRKPPWRIRCQARPYIGVPSRRYARSLTTGCTGDASSSHAVMRRHSSNLTVDVGQRERVRAPTWNHVSTTLPAMKSLAAVVLLVLVSTGCAAKGSSTGGARGPVIQHTDSAQQDHGDFSRPIGQR